MFRFLPPDSETKGVQGHRYVLLKSVCTFIVQFTLQRRGQKTKSWAASVKHPSQVIHLGGPEGFYRLRGLSPYSTFPPSPASAVEAPPSCIFVLADDSNEPSGNMVTSTPGRPSGRQPGRTRPAKNIGGSRVL